MALRAVQKGKAKAGSRWLWLTLVLGGLFVVSQVSGFNQMIAYGYYFTGPTSSITLSYVYLIAMVHLVHVAVGLITLVVVLVQHLRGKYSPGNTLGMELGITFWHFLDALWIYLVLFFYLYQ
jgi:cytochrome c oxidase subunit 3